MSKDTADIQKGFPPTKYEAADYNPLNKTKIQVDPDNDEKIREKINWAEKEETTQRPSTNEQNVVCIHTDCYSALKNNGILIHAIT